MKQSRWRSYTMWIAIVVQLIAIAQLTGLLEKFNLDGGVLADQIAAVLQLLVIFGVLNNPEKKGSL